MANQGLDIEKVPQIRAALNMVTEELIPNVRNGSVAALDLAKAMGAPALIKTCESGVEGSESFVKLLESFVESGESALKEYDIVASALQM